MFKSKYLNLLIQYRFMRTLLFIAMLILMASCSINRTGIKSAPASGASKDSIVFISMRMWHDSLQKSNHIDVLEVFTKPGSLKKQYADSRIQENYLTCILINNKAGDRDSFFTEHPLYKDVEAVGENNQLSMKRLSLKEAQFFVRFQKKNYHRMVIKENAPLKSVKDKELKVIRF